MSVLVGPVDAQEKWAEWKSTHSKAYESEEEEQKRFGIFESNLQEIVAHNEKFQAGDETFSKALNRFADLTSDEVPKGGLMSRKH
ncbi:cathepsin L-like proteinase [Dendroctonus ponderosae]